MKVKNLNWRADEPLFYSPGQRDSFEVTKWEGFGLGCFYEIYKIKTRWRVWLMGKSKASYFKDVDSAKKACQKEFETRVKEWIE